MKFFTIFAVGASVALAAPLESGRVGSIIETRSSTQSCSRESIQECVTATGLEATSCFARICTTMYGTELRRSQSNSTVISSSQRNSTQINASQGNSTADGDDFTAQKSGQNTPASCTEDNLLDCAVTQWKNPDICFQQLCL